MDHTGAYYQTIAILMALRYRNATGRGQWVDISTVQAGATLTGQAILDYTANGRRSRRPGNPDSNRSQWPPMAPHGIYPSEGEDCWVAIACRDDDDWSRLAAVIGEEWVRDVRFATLAGRLEHQDELDERVGGWTCTFGKFECQAKLQAAGVPVAAVQTPQERIDHDENTAAWGMWPTVEHQEMGAVRVDGIPLRMSESPWELKRGAPCLGQHNEEVYGRLLGLTRDECDALAAEGVI
jgi:crotonobetainyl-CoA:carnitine CoA-transferase CaiB-like acyl-CoA transferase